jgi:hypothetical protein
MRRKINNEKGLFAGFLEREERRVAYVVAAEPVACHVVTFACSYMAERMVFRAKELLVEKAAMEEAMAKEEVCRRV